MKIYNAILSVFLFLIQTTTEVDTEFEPEEIYNFVLILLGIILLVLILAYILLSSRQE